MAAELIVVNGQMRAMGVKNQWRLVEIKIINVGVVLWRKTFLWPEETALVGHHQSPCTGQGERYNLSVNVVLFSAFFGGKRWAGPSAIAW